MPCIFISYRRADTNPYAGRLYDSLSDHFGADNVFKDVDDISGGRNFWDVIVAGITRSDVMMVLIGHRWDVERLRQADDITRKEIELGLERDDCLVIPLLVDNASMPKAGDLPPGIRDLVKRNGLPLRDDPDFHNDLDRIISHIEQNTVSSQTRVQRSGIYAPANATPFIQNVAKAANGTDENEFKKALLALCAAKKDPHAVEMLRQIAAYSSIPHRSHQASIALVEFTQYNDIHWPSIEDAALHGDVDTRQQAWAVLGNLGGHESANILAKALLQEPATSPSNRRDIIEHLGKTARAGDFYARQVIFKHYQQIPINILEKQAVIVALRHFKNDDVSVSFLLNEIPNLQGDLLGHAIRSLVMIGTERAIQGIKDLLLSPGDLSRKGTVIVKLGEAASLGKTGSQTARQLLGEIMPRLPETLRNAASEQSHRLDLYLANNP